ncbi:MAG TPA: aspartyl protease family protein [Thermoanaerobaculia bacterium]|jgi:predicted aspartyl protease|nr:aspartyl protease family protein [Thermoanaerobaculia bacterium]
MRRTTLCLLLFLAAGCTTAPGPLTKDEALDRWAAALGGRERLARIRAVHRELALTMKGVSGTERDWTTAAGQSRGETQLAGYSSITTFDGSEGWSADGDAQPHRISGFDLNIAVTNLYMDSFSMFFPDRRPGTIELADANGPYVVLLLKPAGGREARVLLDRRTWLPHAIQQPLQERTQLTTINSWEEVDGVKFPHELLQSTGDPKFDIGITATRTELNPAVDAALFGKPESKLAAIAFPGGASVAISPFRLVQNHIYFPLSVNGSAPTDFIFDTGADFTLIDRKRAEALGLKMSGALETRGSGPASAQTALIPNPRIAFAGLELPLQSIAAIDLGALSLREGKAMEGIVGYGVLSRFIIDIDYARGELRFHDPASYVPDPEAIALPITFYGNAPIVTVKVTGADRVSHQARLLVDTGARAAVDLGKPFLDRTHLAEGPTIDGLLGAGVGGVTTQRIGRLTRIDLAGIPIEAPITSFSTATTGGDADPNFDGLLGGEILRRFTLTVDYPHERLLLRRNAAFHEPFEYDMSGIYFVAIDAKLDRFRADHVIPGSPAALAGVAVGDELVSVDGRAVTSLEELRLMLKKEGEQHVLMLLRGGKTIEAKLATRRLI